MYAACSVKQHPSPLVDIVELAFLDDFLREAPVFLPVFISAASTGFQSLLNAGFICIESLQIIHAAHIRTSCRMQEFLSGIIEQTVDRMFRIIQLPLAK